MKTSDSDRGNRQEIQTREPGSLIHTAGELLRDSLWLLGIHAVVLAMLAFVSMLSVVAPFDEGDLRVFAALTVFLAPGWWLAPRFARREAESTRGMRLPSYCRL